MTKADKPVTRETGALYRGTPLVVTIHAKRVEVRLKGSRESVSVPHDALYELGLKLAARSKPAVQLRRP